eukprot:1545348-Pyramimonas_sp.AAC.1
MPEGPQGPPEPSNSQLPLLARHVNPQPPPPRSSHGRVLSSPRDSHCRMLSVPLRRTIISSAACFCGQPSNSLSPLAALTRDPPPPSVSRGNALSSF